MTDLVEVYRALLVPRLIEERMLALLRQGRLSKWFSGIGQEAIAVGVALALEDDDWILPMHRNLGVFTARGVDLDELFRQILGRDNAFTHGRDRSFHFGTLHEHIVGMISHLGAMLPVADGLALAAQLRGEQRVAAAFTGDGATSEGDFHEALNLAAVWKLPVIFVVENNGWGMSTPTDEQYACADLADRGVGYGMPAEIVDGNDVLEMIVAVSRAAVRARRGEGPTLLECKTFRMRGHEEASGTDYVPEALVAEWAARDPIARFEAVLDLDPATREELKANLRADINERVKLALDAPAPSSTADAETAAVFAPCVLSHTKRAPQNTGSREVRYVDAITDALRTAMREDERVVLLGQDIAEYGGAFKATAGLVDEFGRARVRNTPIVESAAVGAALGLALDGFVPVVEMQFADFISCGFNQIVNNLAKTHYRWGAGVPVVIRAPVGGGMGAGPFHSQNPEAWFTHVAGIKVVAPATPADAKGLLLSAIDDGNPVLFCEHKLLYRSVTGEIADGWAAVPIGEARVTRSGGAATIVAYGAALQWAVDLDADVDVIDLRTLVPWDKETVIDSVRRTGRCLVVHEAPRTSGFGAEVAATIAEECFDALDAPVMRIGGLDTPIPFDPALEAIFSARDRLAPALENLLGY
ncbi:MAG TPA: dehydrogenase E1 component subunit alpha/beta [Acidimicrobiales bacterium]|nr:dehydrogenase E1 component subunit alpha/beta [Acidimicrobiales bacterium]